MAQDYLSVMAGWPVNHQLNGALVCWAEMPGMIAHGLGDSLVTFSYFAKHL